MFSWHPSYTIFSNNIQHHEKHTYTDDNEEWIGISLLRKKFKLKINTNNSFNFY